MIISNLYTPIQIKESDFEVIFDLGFTNDEGGNILSEVTIKKIHDPILRESYSVKDFYGRHQSKLQSLKSFLEQGLNRMILEEDFESVEQFMSILPQYNIRIRRSLPLQEKTLPNTIISSKVLEILKHNGGDISNLVNNLLGGVKDAFEKQYKDEKDKYFNRFTVQLIKRLS
jgi:hypothetical protein